MALLADYILDLALAELDTATATFSASQTALIESTDEMNLMVRVNSGTSAVVLWYGEFMPRLEVTA